MALDAVDCVLLGRPKSSPLSDPTIARVPGALVNLLHEGAAQDFLLAAHVDGGRWFCRGGGPEEDSFNASGLCMQDIALEATQQSSRSSVQTSDLRTRATSNPEAWSACVAYATWCASVIRAEGRPLNMASAGFEPNPLLWAADGWLSQAAVTFAWSWLAQGEVAARARACAGRPCEWWRHPSACLSPHQQRSVT